jgi:LmbE family N-acetylglucosaminyl deacetylase
MVLCEDILASQEFRNDLNSLNAALEVALRAAGEPVAISGNVCYTHLLENFPQAELSLQMAEKRAAIVLMAQRASCFAEVGVAGGHAILLALHANPDIRCVGIDIAERLSPSWPPVEIFVPAAFEWFKEHYPNRVIMHKDLAKRGLRWLARRQPFGSVDMLHLDGEKRKRLAELNAIWPGLAPLAYLMQGDSKNGFVTASTAQMMTQGLARPTCDTALRDLDQTMFQCIEVGRSIIGRHKQLPDLTGKKVLLCVAHQDDETLFAGRLLQALQGKAHVTVACFFQPAKGRADTDTRIGAMQKICADVGADLVQFDFVMDKTLPNLRRYVRAAREPAHIREKIRKGIEHFPLFQAMETIAFDAVRQFTPDVVITHNGVGEYSHREHILLHYVVKAAATRAGLPEILVFGIGQDGDGFVVAGDPVAKSPLFAHYLPQWDGPGRYNFAHAPEVLLPVKL